MNTPSTPRLVHQPHITWMDRSEDLKAWSLLTTWLLLLSSSQLTLAEEPPNKAVTVQTITVTAKSLSEGLLLPSVKTLSGDELSQNLSTSLGETLNSQLGLSATGFGAGASRPIIRGMEGSRVLVLENGMAMSDVSGLSNDHAVANGLSHTKEIEILRGSAALMYGSAPGGGVINIVNDKILTERQEALSISLDSKISSVDQGQSHGVELSSGSGPLALHLEATKNSAKNYAIPNFRELGGPKANGAIQGNALAQHLLPNSFSNSDTLGAGLSLIQEHGYTGLSFEQFNHLYGIPSYEGSQIDQAQHKFDLQHVSKKPMPGIESIKFKLSRTQYKHTEMSEESVASTLFKNDAFNTRLEFAHEPIQQWRGLLGLEASKGTLSALNLLKDNHAAIVPPTLSTSWAGFWVEEKKWQSMSMDLGLRFERSLKKPNANATYSDSLGIDAQTMPVLQDKVFNLLSGSSGLIFDVATDHALGMHYSLTQRAPATDELFAYGAHDATATFDIGQAHLRSETARNMELSLMKTKGPLRWKTNVFYNKIDDFIYGTLSGQRDPQSGFEIRQFNQAAVTQKGLEAEITYRWNMEGSSYRWFTDTSQTQLLNGQYTPLQAPVRMGLDWAYREGPLKTGVSAKHAFAQTHLAPSEVVQTPAYTDLSAFVSYHQRFNGSELNWFMIAKNMLNQDIRYSTTVETLRLYAPQPGRNLSLGVKWYY